MYIAHPIKISEKMGTIAIDEKRLAIQISHATGDGDFCLSLVEHLSHRGEHWEMPKCPRSAEEEFDLKIQPQPKESVFCATDKDLSRLVSDCRDDQASRHFGNFCFTIPFEQIRGFSEADKKIHRISENMWSALLVSHAAFTKEAFQDTKFSI